MSRKAAVLVALGAASSLTYLIWAATGRAPPADRPELHLLQVVSSGDPASGRNLLGVQPYMLPADYATEQRFLDKLDGYLLLARERQLLGPRTLVVFPEYLGTWLVAAGEKGRIYGQGRIGDAMQVLVASNLLAFLRWLPFTRGSDRVKDALFRMKARRMAEGYHHTFSTLAARYRITIVAGSILLPTPRVIGGRLVPSGGPLENVTAVFGPDGQLLPALSRKAFPTSDELPFVRASGEPPPVFDTPAGRLGVLVCADSWYPQGYAALRRQGAEIVAVPSFLSRKGGWSRPWAGYDGAPMPADVDPTDVGRLSEGEAWLRYALGGRLPGSGARAGVNVFLRGSLWDLPDDGRSYAVTPAGKLLAPEGEGAVLLNLWLPRPP